MSRPNSKVRRIFGGKESAPATGTSLTYQRALTNPGDQAVAETLPVGTTYRRFPGPAGHHAWWSYHINVVTAAGATSTLTFWYSNLPDPDPTDATHWIDSGISSLDLTSTSADIFATIADKAPAWIMAKAVVANSTGTIWGYVRTADIDVQ